MTGAVSGRKVATSVEEVHAGIVVGITCTG